MTSICPLSILSSRKEPYPCNRKCEYCPPKALDKIATYSEYWECLNFPNDMFGNGAARDGLGYVSDSLDRLADAIEGGRDGGSQLVGRNGEAR